MVEILLIYTTGINIQKTSERQDSSSFVSASCDSHQIQ